MAEHSLIDKLEVSFTGLQQAMEQFSLAEEARFDRFEQMQKSTNTQLDNILAKLEVLLQKHNLSLSSFHGAANSCKEIPVSESLNVVVPAPESLNVVVPAPEEPLPSTDQMDVPSVGEMNFMVDALKPTGDFNGEIMVLPDTTTKPIIDTMKLFGATTLVHGSNFCFDLVCKSEAIFKNQLCGKHLVRTSLLYQDTMYPLSGESRRGIICFECPSNLVPLVFNFGDFKQVVVDLPWLIIKMVSSAFDSPPPKPPDLAYCAVAIPPPPPEPPDLSCGIVAAVFAAKKHNYQFEPGTVEDTSRILNGDEKVHSNVEVIHPRCNSVTDSFRFSFLLKRFTSNMTMQYRKVLFHVAMTHGFDYKLWLEAFHSVSNLELDTRFDIKVPGATSFLVVMLLVVHFNATIWDKMGQIVSTKARAMYNVDLAGLTFWSSEVNVFCDPRIFHRVAIALAATLTSLYIFGIAPTDIKDQLNDITQFVCSDGTPLAYILVVSMSLMQSPSRGVMLGLLSIPTIVYFILVVFSLPEPIQLFYLIEHRGSCNLLINNANNIFSMGNSYYSHFGCSDNMHAPLRSIQGGPIECNYGSNDMLGMKNNSSLRSNSSLVYGNAHKNTNICGSGQLVPKSDDDAMDEEKEDFHGLYLHAHPVTMPHSKHVSCVSTSTHDIFIDDVNVAENPKVGLFTALSLAALAEAAASSCRCKPQITLSGTKWLGDLKLYDTALGKFYEADTGFAMEIQGTQVAEESFDIIILQNHFASIVNIVKWGWFVYVNIQKFLQLQLLIHIAAVAKFVVAAFSHGKVPLNTGQLLWVHIVMDIMGTLTFEVVPPTYHLVDQFIVIGRRGHMVTNNWSMNTAIRIFIASLRVAASVIGPQHHITFLLVKVVHGPVTPIAILKTRTSMGGCLQVTQLLTQREYLAKSEATWQMLLVFIMHQHCPNFNLEDKVDFNGGGNVMILIEKCQVSKWATK